jgi:hypothetical protein
MNIDYCMLAEIVMVKYTSSLKKDIWKLPENLM